MAARKTPPTNKNTGRPVGETRRAHLERVKEGKKSRTRDKRAERAAAMRRAKKAGAGR